MLKNITQYEIPLLPEEFNLTDGHVYRKWSSEEEEIIDRTSEIMKSVTRQMQADLEREYVSRFLRLSHQTPDFEAYKYLLCTSASLGFEIIANYLRVNKLTLSLIEPCFDNLADIFKRHNVPLKPFPDEYLDSQNFPSFLKKVTTDAICLVTPNNPTGNVLTQDNFSILVEFCKRNHKLLILDCCFRAYLPEEYIFDQYAMLKDSGVDYIIIEDTGKTWPTVELKAPFLVISHAIYQPLYDIYTDMLLHVSPFIIKLMTEFIKNSTKDHLKCIQEIVKANREALYDSIQETLLIPTEKPYISMAWLEVKGMTGFQLKHFLDEKGVHVLPGDFFYWSNHENGKHFIRVALARDPKIFKRAVELLGNVCHNLAQENRVHAMT